MRRKAELPLKAYVFVCSSCNKRVELKRREFAKDFTHSGVCTKCLYKARITSNGGKPFNYTGTEFFSGKILAGWKNSALRRNHLWNLSHEQISELYRKQAGQCALTGLEMGGDLSSPYRASLDRIDSDLGYEPGNVQFVCSVVNVMKNKLPEKLFVELCTKVSADKKGLIKPPHFPGGIPQDSV